MEAHKGIFLGIWELTLDILLVEIFWNGIVNIKQCHCVLADTCADKLA